MGVSWTTPFAGLIWSPFEEEIVVLNFKIALERMQLQAQYCRNPLEPPLEVLEVYNSVA